uniref:Citrate transporter-like domain-containing protein n=1 Tax=Zooxanthella nutricula TaxID=1333877 RepID=A0A7S2Q8Q0_9DINO|mmetsp:Transcript_81387/g.248646  ORF Transcript_81387/g.248646 Transcript_81387/m.248646 type:complete len:674 (+) Transcript_81387:55-2076(+)
MANQSEADAPAAMEALAQAAAGAAAGDAAPLKRSASTLERAGTALQRAGSNLQLQRASTLPTDHKELQHAATMPMMFDQEAHRPCCGGLWKTQQLFGFALGVLCLVILTSVRPFQEYPQANEMLGITAICASFWVFEVIPVYMTALLPLVLMPFLKVTSSEIAAQAYFSWVSMLVVGVFLVDIALEQVHLPRRVALSLLLRVGVVRPGALLGCFMGLCWFFSMFVNSIAVTLLITPFAIGLMNAAEEQVRNTAEAEEDDGEALEGGATQEARSRATERAVRDVQKFADCLLLGIAFAATCGGIATITGTLNHYFLAGEPIVAAKLTWGRWFAFGIPISIVTVLLAYASLYARYVRGLRFAGIDHEVLKAEHDELLSEVGPFSRDELLVALVQILQFVLFIIRPFAISPFITTQFGSTLVNDATIACAPALLLFFIPSVVRPGQAVLTWPTVHEKFDFGLLLLIGGALAINSGFTQSGLNIALGDAFAALVPHAHGVLLDFVIIVVITLCSQVFSSIGTAAAMLPVLAAASQEAVINPLAMMLPAAVATSFAFLLPTATPPNVIVLAKSQELPRPLRIRDFFFAGLPLTIVACVLGAVLTHVMGQAVFDAHSPFPRWACDNSAGGCMFVDVPGIVEGQHVGAQACIVDLGKAAGTLCRLWNGTELDTAAFAPGA